MLNYISAWVGLLTAVLMLSVFLFDRASKKNLFSSARLRADNKKNQFLRAIIKKKSFFPRAAVEIWR
jgi:hypothetical protein